MNVLQILERYHIEYVERGPNVAKGNVNIQCPWCGAEDHSHHMGINLQRGYWGCWRSKQHRGRALYKLVSKLTGLSYQDARRVTGEGQRRAVQLGDMERAVEGLQMPLGTPEGVSDAPNLRFSAGMRPLAKSQYRSAQRFLAYLQRDRRFAKCDVHKVCKRYGLRYCLSGDYADRLIIPVYEHGKLMTYLGRSIYQNATLRYRALDKDKSVKQVKDCIYGYDRALKGGKTLVIVEGALDAMKVDYYNYRKEMRAIALFNMNLEASQLELLAHLKGRYDRYIILLDRGELSASLRLESELRFLNGIRAKFLQGAKDPGDLWPDDAMRLWRRLCKTRD